MRLRDLLITMPLNAPITVHVAGGDCPVNTGKVMHFLARCEFRHLIVMSIIPGNPLIIGCREPKKRKVRHLAAVPAAQKVEITRPGLKRRAPAASLRTRTMTDEDVDQMMAHSRQMEHEAFLETDIYREILRKGGIIPPKEAYRGEYCQTIPIGLRNKRGLQIDEMADELGMTVSEMLERIRERKIA